MANDPVSHPYWLRFLVGFPPESVFIDSVCRSSAIGLPILCFGTAIGAFIGQGSAPTSKNMPDSMYPMVKRRAMRWTKLKMKSPN